MKEQPTITPDRVWASLRSRYNAIRGLDFERLSSQMDAWRAGYLTQLALTMDAIEDRDDVIKCVAAKRKKSVARQGYEILTIDDSPEAKRQKEALEFFYNNLECTNALDLNERGGVRLLLRQMMDSVGKHWAVHEIVWKPAAEGLTAQMKFVPLWFFENTTGKLRFLATEGAVEGIEIKDGEWLVTVGDGVMQACAIAWMFKTNPLKDWLIFCERHGMPGVKGITQAARDSKEWEDMVAAVEAFGKEYAVVLNSSEGIEIIESKGAGDLPYPEIVERADRALARLWRGADLSTISQGKESSGASLQGDETESLEQDDAENISETLNMQIDRWVIRYTFGPKAKQLAYIKVLTENRQDVALDLQVDQFLLGAGAPLGVSDTLERYGRTLPADGEDLLQKPVAPTPGPNGPALGNSLLANEELAADRRDHATLVLIENAKPLLAAAQLEDLSPLLRRIEQITKLGNEILQRNALRALQADLPLLLKQINKNPKAATVMADTFGAAFLNGYVTGKVQRTTN